MATTIDDGSLAQDNLKQKIPPARFRGDFQSCTLDFSKPLPLIRTTGEANSRQIVQRLSTGFAVRYRSKMNVLSSALSEIDALKKYCCVVST
jgi:hypothetical protein